MAHEFYGPTMGAQKAVNLLLNLPATGKEQDWEIELSDPKRIREMIDVFIGCKLNYEERCALVLLIISSIEEGGAECCDDADLDLLRDAIAGDESVREAMVFYWLTLGRTSNRSLVERVLPSE